MHLSSIKISGIRRDGGTQARVRTSEEWIEEMHEAYLAGAKLPAIVVFRDRKAGVDWLADGFHRLEGWIRAYPRAQTIQADVREGELRDAVLFALGCNRKHGLHRTNDDKRRAVQIMLDDPEWKKWSDPRIAEQCGVSVEFVRGRRILQQLEDGQELSSARQCERNGQVYTQGPHQKRPPATPEAAAAKANAIDDLKAAAEAVCAFPELDFERRNIEQLARRLAPDYEPGGEVCSACGQTLPAGN